MREKQASGGCVSTEWAVGRRDRIKIFGNVRVMDGVICESVEKEMSVEVLLLSG
jgi:hypothetical protein